jgi:hypothetical protein
MKTNILEQVARYFHPWNKSMNNTQPSEIDLKPVKFKNILLFFIPLAVQSLSQGLTYPLVAVVASRAEGGPLNYR